MRLALSLLTLAVTPAAAAQSSAYVEQVGDANAAVIEQALAGVGENDVRIRQADGSTADVRQEGAGHLVAGLTGGFADPEAYALSLDGSDLVVRQVGGQNSRAFVDQRDGAFAEILQSGSDNLAVVLQEGGANQAYIDQAGGHTAFVTQNGINNVARVNQTGPLP